MEQSPKHADAQSKKKKRTVVAAFAIGALALGAAGVYATNSITINGDNTIEFGQGSATTNACTSSMTSSISQSWDIGLTGFKVNSVTLGFDSELCSGKVITLSALNSAGTAICGIDGATYTVSGPSTHEFDASGAACASADLDRIAVSTSN